MASIVAKNGLASKSCPDLASKTSSFHGSQNQITFDCQRLLKAKPKQSLIVARSTERATDSNKGKDSAKSSGDDSPEAKVAPAQNKFSSIDRIEKQAKTSIERLKDILYKLKSRTVLSEVSSSSADSQSGTASSAMIINKEEELYISQKIEVDMSSGALSKADIGRSIDEVESVLDEMSSADVAISFPKPGLMESTVQLDAITYTNTTVQFDEDTQTAIVTVSATVREGDIFDQDAYAERAVAMATRALTRACLALDEKAQLALISTDPTAITTSEASSLHKEIVRHLANGQVISWSSLGEENGSSPFRQVFRVLLADKMTGLEFEALFKPVVPGDKYNRWKRAPADWVAYQVSSLLGFDIVPPAVMRHHAKIGDKVYASGVMVYSVADLKPLASVPSQFWGESIPAAVLSNSHILDALLGSSPRKRESFMAGRHWAGVGDIKPCLVDHPMGPGLGELHSMWSKRGLSAMDGLQQFSPATLSKLKGLSRGSLLELLSGALSATEIETILENRDQIVSYCEALISRSNQLLTPVKQ